MRKDPLVAYPTYILFILPILFPSPDPRPRSPIPYPCYMKA